MTVISADGQNVQPITVDEIRLGVAETYDVIVEPKDDSAYTIFAQDIARSGYARGTLTPDLSMIGTVPKLDTVPNLTHTDMGMDMSNMAGMDHSKMNMGKKQKMSTIDSMITHNDSEFGPHVDMRASSPQYRLNDPGVGLRNNGRRVLTYADLKNLHMTHNYPDPVREIQLHLTGNMSRYMWSINGIKFTDAESLRFKLGKVLRIIFVNDTMMNHPMHLHGMWSDLETGDNMYIPRKHTVIVQPGAKISYRVIVDAKCSWAYHCHLLYHMLGMFRRVDIV